LKTKSTRTNEEVIKISIFKVKKFIY